MSYGQEKQSRAFSQELLAPPSLVNSVWQSDIRDSALSEDTRKGVGGWGDGMCIDCV